MATKKGSSDPVRQRYAVATGGNAGLPSPSTGRRYGMGGAVAPRTGGLRAAAAPVVRAAPVDSGFQRYGNGFRRAPGPRK